METSDQYTSLHDIKQLQTSQAACIVQILQYIFK